MTRVWGSQELAPPFFVALIAAKCFLQPIAKLPKHEAEVSAGRFFEKFDDTLAEVLPGFINCTGYTDFGPQVATGTAAKHFFRIRQPIQIFAGKSKFDGAPQQPALHGNFSLDPEFPFLLDSNILDLDLRIVPRETQRTLV